MKFTRSTVTIRLLLYIGIFLLLNLVAGQLFFRLDFTEDGRYTLSNGSKDILKSLTEQDKLVTVTAYFSSNLPPELSRVGEDLKDLLAEYENYSNGQLVYEFIDPSRSEEAKQKAIQDGIAPFNINARENDKVTLVTVFLGAIVKQGNQQEVIQIVQANARGELSVVRSMEFEISSSIKKLVVTNKPKIGVLQGHGEAGLEQMQQVMEQMESLYEVDTFSLASDLNAWSNYKTVVILGATEQFPAEHLASLDQLLASGGRLFLGLNSVQGDLQGQIPWDKTNTGLEDWLSSKGVIVEQTFLTDVNFFEGIMRPVRQGPFVFNEAIDFPYYPMIINFPEHPINQGLEQVLLQFASPITIANIDSSVFAAPIAISTEQSGKVPPPVLFNLDKKWTTQDFLYGSQNVGVAIEGKLGGYAESKMVIVSDGDFPLCLPGQSETFPDNVNLLVNSIDWLTDDTGLIELRTRGVATRPLEKLLGDDEEIIAKKTVIKYSNFLIPILIVIVFGFIRFQRQRIRKKVWMAEDYSLKK